MKRLRLRALSMVAVLTACAALAQAPGGGGRRGGFGMLGLLAIPEVQAELKLEPAQQDLLKQFGREMREKGRQMFMESQGQGQGPEDRGRKFAALRAEEEKQVRQILDARQWARLRQLDLQRSGTQALRRSDVQDDLKLTPDQRQKVAEAFAAEQSAAQPLFAMFRNGQATAPEQRNEIRKKFDEIRTQREARLNAILTDSQKRQFEALKGAPFAFPERRRGPGDT
jgi:Spy/CpxP family protein refolding chaperone